MTDPDDVAADLARQARRRRVQVAVDGTLALMAVLLVTQMWVLSATLESVLAGHARSALPGALLSAALAAGVLGLLRFVLHVEERMEGTGPS